MYVRRFLPNIKQTDTKQHWTGLRERMQGKLACLHLCRPLCLTLHVYKCCCWGGHPLFHCQSQTAGVTHHDTNLAYAQKRGVRTKTWRTSFSTLHCIRCTQTLTITVEMCSCPTSLLMAGVRMFQQAIVTLATFRGDAGKLLNPVSQTMRSNTYVMVHGGNTVV